MSRNTGRDRADFLELRARKASGILGLIAALLLVTGCVGGERETPSPASRPATAAAGQTAAPTWDELLGGTFHGIAESNQPVTLVGGHWDGALFAEGGASRPSLELLRDFHLSGDLDGDGTREAAVLLGGSSGGTGTNSYLAIVGRRNGRLENLATALLGDRVQLRGATIDRRRITLDLVQPGPSDAACCPGELVSRTFELIGDRLIESLPGKITGRLALATFAGREWVLRAWSIGESATDTPEVTLMLKDGRLTGHAGCNNYFASAADGDLPGAIVLGPAASTRRSCKPPLSAVESRYLRQLGQVTGYGFVLGRLALTYKTDAGPASMLFEEKK